MEDNGTWTKNRESFLWPFSERDFSLSEIPTTRQLRVSGWGNGKLNAMQHLLSIALLVSLVAAQSAEDATELLRRVRTTAENTKNWRAEVVEISQIAGPGINVQSEVRTKIAVQAPLKMARQNSGSDRTIFVCDGVETFYSGDGHGYYKGDARVTPQCYFPLIKFYVLDNDPASASVVGRDHVRLAYGDRECVLVRAAWKRATLNVVRTMCIDPAPALILRDVMESEDERTGIRSIKTTTFTDYESNPALPSNIFQFSIPPSAVEAKPPN
jgi:outer membrane lipoprotein-sorting protein